jgi:hypothetical protein
MKFDEFVPIDYTLRKSSQNLCFLFSRTERSIGPIRLKMRLVALSALLLVAITMVCHQYTVLTDRV